MADDYEHGPWIEHDGRHPVGPNGGPWPARDSGWKIHPVHEGGGRAFHPAEEAAGGVRDRSSPCWFWSWRRKGWFSRKRVRVCDNPEYAPIVKYRWRRWRRAKSAQVEMLREISAGTRQPVDEPAVAPFDCPNARDGAL